MTEKATVKLTNSNRGDGSHQPSTTPSASKALVLALTVLAEQGCATPCQGRRRDRWTSENAEERAWAASVCLSLACPVLEECGTAAVERKEKFGTWGGRDRTARGNTATTPRTSRTGAAGENVTDSTVLAALGLRP